MSSLILVVCLARVTLVCQGHLHDVDDHLGTSKMFLSMMARRMQGNQARACRFMCTALQLA